MRIVVLLKQVPAELKVSMNADYTMNRQYTQKITNPADQSALAMAIEWKNQRGGEVLCLTMGPASAADCLREAAEAGADGLYHICDPGIAGADTLVTAKILTAAIRKIGGADLVFCGRQTVDGETGQVGAEIAAMLGWACLSQILQVQAEEKNLLRCTCLNGSHMEIYSLRYPAVLCVCENRTTASLPSLAAMRRANQMRIETFSLADLGLNNISGRRSSPTRVAAVHQKTGSRRHTIWLTDRAAETVAEVIRQKAIRRYDG